SRGPVIAILVLFYAVFVVNANSIAVALLSALDPQGSGGDGHRRVLGRGQIRFDGFGPERWALRFRQEPRLSEQLRRRLVRQRYVVLHDPSVTEAINLAAATYGNGEALWRKAACES